MNSNSIGYKIAHFPLTRIIVGLIAIVVVSSILQLLLIPLVELLNIDSQWKYFITDISLAITSFLAYYFLYKFYEKRKIDELSFSNFGQNFGYGSLLGFVLLSLSILVMYIGGCYKVISVNSVFTTLPVLGMAIASGISEEIVLRGIMFRLIEEKLGSYIAIIITALIFGLLHIWNPNSSLYASLSIAIEAGILLAVAYMLTRNLWFPIGIHFMWNFTQGGIYGANVSGIDNGGSIITAQISGSAQLTGGAFGPEASIQAPIICMVASIIILILCHKHGKIIRPFWVKN